MKNLSIIRLACISLFSLIAFCRVCGQGKNGSMLSDGRMWVYQQQRNLEISYYALRVEGDTFVGGYDCKNIVKIENGNETPYRSMREEGKKVYAWNGSEWKLLFDFGLEIGDEFKDPSNPWLTMFVGDIDTVQVDGREYRRLHFGFKGDEYYDEEDIFEKNEYVWYENVGSNLGLMAPFELESSSTWSRLQSCYDGDTRIFTSMGSPWTWNQSYNWHYAYIRDWNAEGDYIYGAKEDVRYARSDYEAKRIELNGKRYIPVICVGHEEWGAIGVREANGRIYVDHEAYKESMSKGKGSLPTGNPDYLPYPITSDGEVILYDYNLEAGDVYCSVEGQEDITVTKKENIRLKDMEVRRKLTLSNGMILIEGLGCINSPGLYFYYLNPAEKNLSAFGGLMEYTLYGSNNSIFIPDWTYKDTEMGLNNTKDLRNAEKSFDLQGRQLKSAPQKGIYIQNGKKVLVK